MVHAKRIIEERSKQSGNRLGGQAFSINTRSGQSVYDAPYCALAIARHSGVATADRTLANKLQDVFPFIVHLSAIRP